jgi:hypothetical protein
MKKLKKTKRSMPKGKLLNKVKLTEMPKFQRKPSEDPNAEVKIKKVSMGDMIETVRNKNDEALGIY